MRVTLSEQPGVAPDRRLKSAACAQHMSSMHEAETAQTLRRALNTTVGKRELSIDLMQVERGVKTTSPSELRGIRIFTAEPTAASGPCWCHATRPIYCGASVLFCVTSCGDGAALPAHELATCGARCKLRTRKGVCVWSPANASNSKDVSDTVPGAPPQSCCPSRTFCASDALSFLSEFVCCFRRHVYGHLLE